LVSGLRTRPDLAHKLFGALRNKSFEKPDQELCRQPCSQVNKLEQIPRQTR